jgi:hypothetical protein
MARDAPSFRMGLLDNLLNRNPTRDWQPQRGLELVLDLDQETFCGIGFGDPVARLTKLGPAEDARAARVGVYRYPSRGFGIIAEQGRVVEFEVSFFAEERYGGAVRISGRAANFGETTTEADVVAALGGPTERKTYGEPSEQTVTLQYRRTRGIWEFELDEAGRLEAVLGSKRDD